MTWIDIALTDWDGNSPFDEDILSDIHNNQEELALVPYEPLIEELSDNQTSYTLLYDGYVYLPPPLALTSAPVQYVMQIASRRSTTAVYYLRARLAGGSWIEVGPLSNTTYAFQTFTFPDGDVKAAAAAGESTLEIEGYRSSGTGSYFIQNYGGRSRFELEP